MGMKGRVILPVIASILIIGAFALPQQVFAVMTTIDFDGVDATGGPVTGPALDAYLAGFGVSVSGVTSTGGGQLQIVHETIDAFAVQILNAVSSPNIFWCSCANSPFSYDVNFATPLDSFTFTRTPYISFSSSGVTVEPWRAQAFDSDGTLLDTVFENALGSFGTIPANTLTLNGPDIVKVTFDRTTTNTFRGVNIPPTDNWILEFTPILIGGNGQPVAGELMPLNTGALLLGGLATSAFWIVPIGAAVAGTGIYIAKTRLAKDEN